MENTISKCCMRKPFSDYKLYVFDLDGTLYFQKKLRLIMACRLAFNYALHPFKIKELLILKKFREVRDKWTDTEGDIDKRQYEHVALRMNSSPEYVQDIVKRWIYDNPLDAVEKSKDSVLIKKVVELREAQKKVVIFSDYPTSDKLKALGIDVDGEYCSADDCIGELKPSSKGLEIIINDFSVDSEDVIMIGDRLEKDGMCAIGAECDYLILNRGYKKRQAQYNTIVV